MEKFLIDDGIKQSKIIANRYKWSAENADMGSEDANELHADICNQYVKEHEQIAEWLEELKSYKDIGTLKELKEFKENGAFTGLELAKLAIMQNELKKYKDLEEQGLLVRLPVSIGTNVYMIASTFDCIYNYDNCKAIKKWKCEEDIKCEYERKSYYVKEIEFTSILKDSIGNSVFLTREEAEKKLEEMKND